jgi:diguanylate cyclase (GGDEF)-like protein
VGIWLMGAAACQGPMRPVQSVRGEALRRIAVPLGFGGAALALLAFGSLVGINPVAVALATACILVVMGRLLVTFRDHVAMLTDSRREALSDPLTSLGNRRALQADLARAMAASLDGEHHALILLELEGVKEFNDTLGRTAGDALLVRLASRLATLAGAARPAYRTRGGEFAIVAPLQPGEDSDELALKLAGSLAECIDGIEVRCHGAGLTMGDEAGTIPAAMRLADQRLHERRTALQTA